jgi:hypothetical protein
MHKIVSPFAPRPSLRPTFRAWQNRVAYGTSVCVIRGNHDNRNLQAQDRRLARRDYTAVVFGYPMTSFGPQGAQFLQEMTQEDING